MTHELIELADSDIVIARHEGQDMILLTMVAHRKEKVQSARVTEEQALKLAEILARLASR